MDPMTIVGATWIGITGYQTYAYWKRKKETREARARGALEMAIAEEQANIRAAFQEDYWREREEVRLKKLAHEKQQRKLEQDIERSWKRIQDIRKDMRKDHKHPEIQYQPNPQGFEEEIERMFESSPNLQ